MPSRARYSFLRVNKQILCLHVRYVPSKPSSFMRFRLRESSKPLLNGLLIMNYLERVARL
jgi:hypothetical protein